MRYQVRLAEISDLSAIETIYGNARLFMEETGNPSQWGKTYPSRQMICNDMEQKKLYVLTEDGVIHGVFYFSLGMDPTYEKIEGRWRAESAYGTIHRIAGDGSGGIVKAALAYCAQRIDHIRIDTHENNHVMQKALEKLGFRKCGIILTDDGTLRIAYDYLK